MNGYVGLFEIVVVILVSSFFSLGGGNGPIAVIQNQWVERGVLDSGLLAWVIALGYFVPGPKAAFLSGVGYYLHGFLGALAALMAITIPACLGAAGTVYGMERLRPVIDRISLAAGFIISGMIAAAAWGMAAPLDLKVWEYLVIFAVAVLVGWKNIKPVWIILAAVVAGLILWLE